MNELTTPGRLGRVRATAYSKLTLSLRVLGKRPDGFHELEALAVSIADPHDVVEVEAVPHPGGITLEIEGETDDVPEGPRNLAFRAADDLMLRAGRSGHGVKIKLRKKIPAGGGLGGGSADAAAAMLAVRRMLELDVDDTTLDEIAARLGSDVTFCVRGGAAWMRGRGELLTHVDLPVGLPYLVALPPFRLATPQVYAAWDELGGPQSTRVVEAVGPVAAVLPELVNDLEPAAEAVEPRMREFREDLEAAAGAPAILAGSGSAYAVALEPGASTTAIVRKVARALRVPVAAGSTTSRGVRLGVG